MIFICINEIKIGSVSSSLFILEKRNGAAQNVDVGIEVFCDSLKDQHVGQQNGDLAIYLDVMLPHNVKHFSQNGQSLQGF